MNNQKLLRKNEEKNKPMSDKERLLENTDKELVTSKHHLETLTTRGNRFHRLKTFLLETNVFALY